MDWNLRGCARHGHATYAPDEAPLAARLQATTAAGPAWRCLRCGAFVPGPPRQHGPARDAPQVLRGRALRDATVLRLFAVERWVRALVLGLLAVAVLRFESDQTSLQALFAQVLPAARPLANLLNIDLSHSPTVARIQTLLGASHGTLTWVAVGLFGYAAVELAEGVGLWSLRRWGEYLAVVATAVFLPVEVYELTHKISWLRVTALLINLVLVVYLVVTKHLFGARGGGPAYARERQSESLLEVEAAAANP